MQQALWLLARVIFSFEITVIAIIGLIGPSLFFGNNRCKSEEDDLSYLLQFSQIIKSVIVFFNHLLNDLGCW